MVSVIHWSTTGFGHWTFGNGGNGGLASSLYITAGPNGETGGLFARIDATQVPEPSEFGADGCGNDILAWRRRESGKAKRDLRSASTSEQDQLRYVNGTILGKVSESKMLQQQAANNSREQFANSPDLQTELQNAIIESDDAPHRHENQALNSTHCGCVAFWMCF